MFYSIVYLFLAIFGMFHSCYARKPGNKQHRDGNNNLPTLNMAGFTWAENLCFDGHGNLFVSDSTRGEIWRIYLCPTKQSYCNSLHLKGFKSIAGLTTDKTGDILYAGVKFEDGTTGIVATNTNQDDVGYQNIAKTSKMVNGLAMHEDSATLYYTNEGTPETGGYVYAIYSNWHENLVKDGIFGADGAWVDQDTQTLFIGVLKAVDTIYTFDIQDNGVPNFTGQYRGLPSSYTLDDFTLYGKFTPSPMNKTHFATNNTFFLGADFSGGHVVKFDINGAIIEELPLPNGIEEEYPVTSVRWGKGEGFDSNSIYVTQGGGIRKTQKDRRVFQITLSDSTFPFKRRYLRKSTHRMSKN